MEKAAPEYSIKELENAETRDGWYNSIKRGNRQLSTIGDKKYYFQADPVFGAFKHLDEKMQPCTAFPKK